MTSLSSESRRQPIMIDRIQEYQPSHEEQVEELKALALDYARLAQARLAEGNEFIKDYLTRKPAQALGIALGVGVVLGWLIKRR
jgi:ElaB/YqjD/DUF883 family membrane-anchored ribosome-binding protein